MNQQLLEPLKFYEQEGKQLHLENARKHFDALQAKSGVNAEENRATVRAYYKEKSAVDALGKKIARYKLLRVLLILTAIAGGAVLLYSLVPLIAAQLANGFILLGVGVATLIVSLLLILKKLNPAIRRASETRDKCLARCNELFATAEAQMAPLNALFDSTDTLQIIEKTIPDFRFTDHFTKEHEELFRRHHDFADDSNDNTSMTDTLAGSFAGNPFLFCRRLVHTMGTKTYHGTKVIHWTESYRGSDGKRKTRVRTQTLHASLTKPFPYYSTESYLCYGSQAAPDLCFSRLPQHSERLDEDDIEKKVKKGAKKLRKKAAKATQKGGNFQEMANEEFDVLFGATDRDHEVQFRLMYTPLAQQNTVQLLTSRTGFGDDFRFTKRRRFNLIQSEHAAHWEMNTSASNYYSFDFDEAKERFLGFNERYFKSLFFDFAPLFSVPAYLETPCASLEPIEEYECNYPQFEHEVMANAIGDRSFMHERSRTKAILKTSIDGKREKTDRVLVTAHSFSGAMRTDFVPVLGGDGRMHAVPVIWEEFLPVCKTTPMSVAPAPYSEKQLRDAERTLPKGTFFHGLVANITK